MVISPSLSRAITSYVSEKYKEQGSDLIKHDNLLEAVSVKQWMEVESQNYNPDIQPIIYQKLCEDTA
ncbi:hypothetical protein V2J09_003000 [Rumex salicifolius]